MSIYGAKGLKESYKKTNLLIQDLLKAEIKAALLKH